MFGKGMGKGMLIGPMGPMGPGLMGGMPVMGPMGPGIMIGAPLHLVQEQWQEHERQQDLERRRLERDRERDQELQRERQRVEEAQRAERAAQAENLRLQRELQQFRNPQADVRNPARPGSPPAPVRHAARSASQAGRGRIARAAAAEARAMTPSAAHRQAAGRHYNDQDRDLWFHARMHQGPEGGRENGLPLGSVADSQLLAEALRRSLDPRHQAVSERRNDSANHTNLQIPQLPYSQVEQMCNGLRHDTLLGRGAFGSVYRGVMQGSRGRVDIAVKIFERRGIGNTQNDFMREVQMMSSCRHQNIVPVLFMSTDVNLCIVMPLMSDGSLERLLQEMHEGQRGCPADQRARYARDMFEGLSYLHDPNPHRIVHRDIKPDNILLHGSTAKLGDVGLAKDLHRAYTMTQVGGTPLFIDPVYARTGRLTAASDVYSAGVVLLQLLTGADSSILALDFRSTQDGASRWEARVRRASQGSIADPAAAWQPRTAQDFHSIAARCTELDAARRPASSTVRDELDALLPVGAFPGRGAQDNSRTCLICLDAPPQGLLRPCGHNATCESCYHQLRTRGQAKCPLCRANVMSFERGNFRNTFG